MVKKEELFVLIKSLTKSEKRYFKLFCTREASGENYLKLFDAIDKQAEYNEKFIKEKFDGQKFTEQMHVTKNYLMKLILKSLRNFHAGISKDAEMKDALRNVEILYNKELYRHSLQELKRAEAIAEMQELTTGLVEIANWKRKLEQLTNPHNYNGFKKIVDDQRKLISRLLNTNRYWRLAIDISGGLMNAKKKEFKGMDLLTDQKKAQTLEAKVLQYNTAYLWCLQNDKPEEAGQKLFDLIELLEQYPERINDEPGLYVSTINNLLSFLVFTKKYREAMTLAQKAKSVFERWSITSANRSLLKQILRTYNIELEIHRDLKSFSESANFITTTEHFVKDNMYKMPKEYLVSFWFQLASIHFMRHNFKESLYWINQLLNARLKGVRSDLVVQTQILNLIVHLEQNNLFVLRYFVDSARRYMKKIHNIQLYENILLKFFTKIGRLPLLNYKDAFVELKQQLFPDDMEALVPEEALGYIDYRTWINDKIATGITVHNG